MKRVFNLVIVDESGSMYTIAKQALAGMNETVETVKSMQKRYPEMEQRLTLLTFDSDHTTFLLDNAPGATARSLSTSDYRPGGATPLYDAIAKGVNRVNAQAAEGDRVLVTIITDGLENCSTDYNLAMIKNLIGKQKAAGWTFALIGTDDLDVEGMAGSMQMDNKLSFARDEAETRAMFEKLNHCRERYCSYAAIDRLMSPGDFFNDDEEEEASQADKKKK